MSNKVILLGIFLVAVALGYFFTLEPNNKEISPITEISPAEKTVNSPNVNVQNEAVSKNQNSELENFYDEEIKPATQVYSNARDAYDQIIAGVKNYDDITLEQFASMNTENCSWCAELFASLKETMLATQDEDTKSYIAELLSITGDQGNLETLIDSYQKGNDSDQEIYLEALELTAGDDQLVNFLNSKIDTNDPTMQESLIAAISNHGSALTVETLYQRTIEHGDPNGYYDYGMGLGELIPDAEALPKLIEIAGKKDQYSHLAVKALLNYGDDGLREVVNIISNSNDAALNQQLLIDAIDHVSFDENTAQYIDELINNNPHPDIQKFAQEIKSEMDYEFTQSDDDEDDLDS